MDDAERLARDLSLREIRIALAVNRLGGILKASEALNVSQPAVTKVIQQLERKLGLPIFDRTAKGVVPTEYGRVFLARASELDGDIKAIGRENVEYRFGTTGRVRIGAMPVAAASVVPRAMAQFLERSYDCELEIIEGTREYLDEMLRRKDIDLIVGRLPVGEDDGIERELLIHDPFKVVVRHSHPLVQREHLELDEMMRWKWIFPPENSDAFFLVESAFRARFGALPEIVAYSLSLPVLQRLTAWTDCLCFLPMALLKYGRVSDVLVTLPLDLQETLGPIGISRRKSSRTSFLVQEFEGILRGVVLDIGN